VPTYGYTVEEFRSLTVDDISSGVPPYTRADAARWIETAKAGEPVSFEWQRKNRDGSLHWDEVCLKAARIGGTPRILAFTRDVTARKAAEDALRASEEQYRAIFNASADALVLWNSRFQRVDVNPAYERMYGFSRDKVLAGAPARDLPAEDLRPGGEIVARTLAGERCDVEIDTVGGNGERFQVEVRTIPIQHRGEPHVLAMIRDVTHRREAEQRRAELEAQLRQAQKMEAIGHLTGGIAHDFNNLLTSIMGYVALASERSAGSDGNLVAYLGQASLSCARARDLIQQMLTFSRGHRGEPRALALAPLVRESAKLLRSSFPATVELHADLDDDAPPVLLDPVQLEQVLMNLAINARDAMHSIGTIRVSVQRAVRTTGRVCTSCRKDVTGELVELTVADTGPGVPPEVLERMFEPFFTTKEVGQGSGMGLSTVHGIVHEHGGHIVVETTPCEGARFRVLLPALRAPDGSAARRDATVQGRGLPQATLGGRVAVVDDEASVALFMHDLLAHWGLSVTTYLDAVDALQAIAQGMAFDLVITDETMPGMTGLELAQALHALDAGLPILLYTGYGNGVTEADLERAGVAALVRKPVEPAVLLAVLKCQLPKKAAPDGLGGGPASTA
jgi:PAS domain S-box-containing protein